MCAGVTIEVMSDSGPELAAPGAAGAGETAELLSRLTATLDTLAAIARGLHLAGSGVPAELIGAQDAALADASRRFRAVSAPADLAGLRDQLSEAADLALGACAELRAAAQKPALTGAAFRGLGLSTRAVEALYPLTAALPEVSRWFLSPAQRGDAGLLKQLRPPGRPGTGVQHVRNERGTRGGYSVYVPEYLDPATPVPLVMALHGGSGHGRSFLWTWLREARGRGLIVVAPTATGDTWSISDPDTDMAHLDAILAQIRSEWSIDPGRMLLTGISDGGTFTLVSGLTQRSPFTHLAPIAAGFHPILMYISDPDRTRGLPIYLIHGEQDWMFPVAVAREAYALLSSAGAQVSYHEIAHLAHTYPAEHNELIIDWLNAG